MFREWFRFSCNRGAATLLLILPGGVSAESRPPQGLLEVQVRYQKSEGIQAQFSQITEIRSTKQKKKAKGRIWVKRPNKLRWETLEPDPNILVSDGRVFWFYTPPFEAGERGQVIIRKKGQVQTQFLNALLSGSFDFGKDAVSISEQGPGKYLLKPKLGTAGDVLSAEITIHPEKKLISSVKLEHTSGNITQIQLDEIHLAQKLEESLFQFVIDKNTDRIVE